MPTRIYLMPLIGTGTLQDGRAPKYMSLFDGDDITMSDYGLEPVCLVAVSNISTAAHNSVVANADVTALPADLTQIIGGQLTAVQTALASINLPGDWVQSGFTYLQVLRVVLLIFKFAQRLNPVLRTTRLFGGGVNLSTQINQLSAPVRTALGSAATSLGFDTSSLAGATTLRAALKAMADQFPNDTLHLGAQQF